MNKEEIIKQFIYTLEDDIKNKTFLTYEEENEWKDYLERIINSQVNKYKEVLDKIKEKCLSIKGNPEHTIVSKNELVKQFLELLEEIE